MQPRNKTVNSQICEIGLREITRLVWRDQGPLHATVLHPTWTETTEHESFPAQINLIKVT